MWAQEGGGVSSSPSIMGVASAGVWTGQGSPSILSGCKNRTLTGKNSTYLGEIYILDIDHALFCLPRIILYISNVNERNLSFLLFS